MKDVSKVQANPNTRKTDSKAAVDPKEFQKSLEKVEKSDETEDKKKKSQGMGEEEIELDEDSGSVSVPEGLFKSMMEDEAKGANIYDTEEATKPNLVPEEDLTSNPASEGYIPEFDPNQTSNINVSTQNISNQDLSSDDFLDDSGISMNEELSTSSSSTEFSSNQEFSQSSYSQQNNEGIEQNQQPEKLQSSSDKNEESKKTEKATKKKTTKKSEKKDPAKKKEEAKQEPDQQAVKAEKADNDQKELDFSLNRQSGEEGEKLLKNSDGSEGKKTNIIDGEKETEEVAETANVDTQQGQSDQKGDNPNDPDTSNVVAPMTAASIAAGAAMEGLKLSPFSNIPKDVFELFQKMVGLMTLEKNNGKTTTTITLNMPNSIFNGGELVLDHYDTAPHAYNVQFLGDPEAVAKFAQNMKGLNNAITEAKLNFSINVLSPKLSKNYTNRIESSDERSDGQQKDGEKKQK